MFNPVKIDDCEEGISGNAISKILSKKMI